MSTPDTETLIAFSASDNVAIALADLEPGVTYPMISGDGGALGELRISPVQPAWYADDAGTATPIRRYYKVATRPIARHEPIIKDQVAIGEATEDIEPGQVVHNRFRSQGGVFQRIGGNIREHANAFSPPAEQLAALTAASRITSEGLARAPRLRPRDGLERARETLMGYAREDGPFGSRNHLLVIPSVFCVNQEAIEIAGAFAGSRWGTQGENAVVALPHATGCCQVDYDEAFSLRLLANMIAHPNVGAAVIVTLGCSPLCVQDRLREQAASLTTKPIRSVSVQALGRESALIAGKAAVAELLSEIERARRVTCPLDELLLAVKCGASDLTSGLFANTLTGHVADLVLDAGGAVVISEVMEFFGAERALRARCRDPSVWLDLLRIIKTNEMIGKAAAAVTEQDIHSMELTMGNIAAGLSAQEEKSLGAVRKMGFSHPIENVVRFGERLAAARPGLYVMDGPGQDLISSTGLGAAGAQAMIFTTGLGTPLGNALTPVVKITGNRETAARQPDFIDLHVPFVERLREGLSAREVAQRTLWRTLVETLEGRPTRAELNGHRDFGSRGYAMVQ